MKLIDLLVQELPGRGGWPKTEGDLQMIRGLFRATWSIPRHAGIMNYLAFSLDSHECVSREQYESALAASQRPAWGGEGIPPEGSECEVKSGKDSWTLCKVVHSSSAGVAFIYLEEPSSESSSRYLGVIDSISHKHAVGYFRPIRSEAERKREETVSLIMSWMHHAGRAEIELIYDFIAAGKIPGILLE